MDEIIANSLTSSENVLRSSTTNSTKTSNDMMEEFQQLLLLATLSSMSLDTGSLFGSSDSSGTSGGPFAGMSSLMEQLLSMQIQTGNGTTDMSSMLRSYATPLGKAPQINQFDGERQVGGDGINSNCGPTSLVMALHQQGLRVAGETAGMSSGKAIELARKSMAANSSYDGLTSRGKRSEAENNVYTDFDDLARGATAAGARTQMLTPTTSAISRAIEGGSGVIVSGTFAGKSPLPWTGDRGPDNKSAPGNAGSHIVLVSGYNNSSNSFTVNDPARNKPIQVSAAALSSFMDGNAGAIAIHY